MKTAIEQLRKLVIEGKEGIPNLGARTFTLLQELTFFENRKQENYFLAMYRYVKGLKSMPDALIGPEYMRPVFALIDEKVTIEEEHRKVKRCIMDVLNAPKGLVSIDVNDVRDLFQEGGVIHAFDVSVDALMANRMNLMMVEITKKSTRLEPFNHALVFFFFPEEQPLRMDELQPFSDWIESIPGEFMIKWGMATQSMQELRAIVLLQ